MSRFASLLSLALAVLLTACESTSPRHQQQIDYRRLEIAAEAPGDYYVARRFNIERTHIWGYVRRPGQSWDQSKLVMMNEKFMKQPDRFSEMPSGDGPAFGSDHNREYRLWGYFSGRRVYDPNSNLALPEFVLQRYEVKSVSPGWLFNPGERFNGKQLLRAEPGSTP
ncbi:hypothetical protein EI77_00963 [Prosthecobacter fusiformis]|uniref:Uncharacterized protein n=1 Tax=Prosthecobacter fusiformis TaxID=48464 RepID=A0A4V3FI99_9BACT|nr:hypothetical protein [Prosthecobacter fusiformis]TDU81653.1 hypothetical protein EI77_00963 [Prosthecobacter fusiformis]